MASIQLAVDNNLEEMKEDNTSEECTLQSCEYDLRKMSSIKNPKMFIETTVEFMESIYAFASSKSYFDQIFLSRKYFKNLMDRFTDESMDIFIKYVTKGIIEKIIDGNSSDWCIKKEHLKSVNTLLLRIMNNIYFMGIVNEEISPTYICKLLQSLGFYGDVELQATILQLIFTLYGKLRIIANLTEAKSEMSEVKMYISQIEETSFEEDCRKFLNKINENQGKIFSIQCKNIQLNHDTYIIPLDSKCGVWVDFNLLDKVISWHQQVYSPDMLEIISLFHSEVKKVFLGVHKENIFTITLNLRGSCITSITENQDTVSKIKSINLIVEKTKDGDVLIKEILHSMFGNKYKYSRTKQIRSLSHNASSIKEKKGKFRDSKDTPNVSLAGYVNPVSPSSTFANYSNDSRRFSDIIELEDEDFSCTDDPNRHYLPEEITTESRNTQILAGCCTNTTINYKAIIRSQDNISPDFDSICRTGPSITQSSMFFSPEKLENIRNTFKMDKNAEHDNKQQSDLVVFSKFKKKDSISKIPNKIEESGKNRTFTFSNDKYVTCTEWESANNVNKISKRSSASENVGVGPENDKLSLDYEEQVICTRDAITENSQQSNNPITQYISFPSANTVDAEDPVIKRSRLNDGNKLQSQYNVGKQKRRRKSKNIQGETVKSEVPPKCLPSEHINKAKDDTGEDKIINVELTFTYRPMLSSPSFNRSAKINKMADKKIDTQEDVIIISETRSELNHEFNIKKEVNSFETKLLPKTKDDQTNHAPTRNEDDVIIQLADDEENDEIKAINNNVVAKNKVSRSKKSRFGTDEIVIDVDHEKVLKAAITNKTENQSNLEDNVAKTDIIRKIDSVDEFKIIEEKLHSDVTQPSSIPNYLEVVKSTKKSGMPPSGQIKYKSQPQEKSIFQNDHNSKLNDIDKDKALKNIPDTVQNNKENHEVIKRKDIERDRNRSATLDTDSRRKNKKEEIIFELDDDSEVDQIENANKKALSTPIKAKLQLTQAPSRKRGKENRCNSVSPKRKRNKKKLKEPNSDSIEIIEEEEHDEVANFNKDFDDCVMTDENNSKKNLELQTMSKIEESVPDDECYKKIEKAREVELVIYLEQLQMKTENQTTTVDAVHNTLDTRLKTNVDECRAAEKKWHSDARQTVSQITPRSLDENMMIKRVKTSKTKSSGSHSKNLSTQETLISSNVKNVESINLDKAFDTVKKIPDRVRNSTTDTESLLESINLDKAFDAVEKIPDRVRNNSKETERSADATIEESLSQSQKHNESAYTIDLSELTRSQQMRMLKENEHHKFALNQNPNRSDNIDENSNIRKEIEDQYAQDCKSQDKSTQLKIDSRSKIGKHSGRNCKKRGEDEIENTTIDSKESTVAASVDENLDNTKLSTDDVMKTPRVGRRRRKLYDVNSVMHQRSEEEKLPIDEDKNETIEVKYISTAESSFKDINQENEIIEDNTRLGSNDFTKTLSAGQRTRRKLYDVSSVIFHPTEEKHVPNDEDKIETIEIEDIPDAASSVDVVHKENEIIEDNTKLSSNDITKTPRVSRRREKLSARFHPTKEKDVPIDEDKIEGIPAAASSVDVINKEIEIIEDNTKLISTDVTETPSVSRRRTKLYDVSSVMFHPTDEKHVPNDEDKIETIEIKDIPAAASSVDVVHKENEIYEDNTKLSSKDVTKTPSVGRRRKKLSAGFHPTEEKYVPIDEDKIEDIPAASSSVDVINKEIEIIEDNTKLISKYVTETPSVSRKRTKLHDVSSVDFHPTKEIDVPIDEDKIEDILAAASSVDVIIEEIEIIEDSTKLISKDVTETPSVSRRRTKLYDVSSARFHPTEEKDVPIVEDKIEDIPAASSSVDVINKKIGIIEDSTKLSSKDFTKTPSVGRQRKRLSARFHPTEEKDVPIVEDKIEDVPAAASSVDAMIEEIEIIEDSTKLVSKDVTETPSVSRRRTKLYDVSSVRFHPIEEKDVPIDEDKIEGIPAAASSVDVINKEIEMIKDNTKLISKDVTKTSSVGRQRKRLSARLHPTEEKDVPIVEDKIENIPAASSSVDVINKKIGIIEDNTKLSSKDFTKTPSVGRRRKKLSAGFHPTEEKDVPIDEDKIEGIPAAASSVDVINKEIEIIEDSTKLISKDVTKTSSVGRQRKRLSARFHPTEEKDVPIVEDKIEDIPAAASSVDAIIEEIEIIEDSTKLISKDVTETPSVSRRRTKLYDVSSVMFHPTDEKHVPNDEDKIETIEIKDIPAAASSVDVVHKENEIFEDNTKLSSKDVTKTPSVGPWRKKLSAGFHPTEEKYVPIDEDKIEDIPAASSSVDVIDQENEIIDDNTELNSSNLSKTSSVSRKEEFSVETSSVDVIDQRNEKTKDHKKMSLKDLSKKSSSVGQWLTKEEISVAASSVNLINQENEITKDSSNSSANDLTKNASVGRRRRKLYDITSIMFQPSEEEKYGMPIDENENILHPPKKPMKSLGNYNENINQGNAKELPDELFSSVKGMKEPKRNFNTSTKLEEKKKRKSKFDVTYSEVVAEEEAFKRKCRNFVRAQTISVDEFYKLQAKRRQSKNSLHDYKDKKMFNVRPITRRNYELKFSPKRSEWDELRNLLEFDRRESIGGEKSGNKYSKKTRLSSRNSLPITNPKKKMRKEDRFPEKKINIISNICIKPANRNSTPEPDNFEEFQKETSRIEDDVEIPPIRFSRKVLENKVSNWTAPAFFNNEFIMIDSKDYIGKFLVIFFYPFDCGELPGVLPSIEIQFFIEHFEQFQKLNTSILGCSVDSIYTHKLYIKQLLRENKSIDRIQFPLIGDTGFKICEAFNVIYPNMEHSYRAVIIIDPEGKIIKKIIVDVRKELLLSDVLNFMQVQTNSH